MHDRPARVAIIGGGCASLSAALELTRPEHNGAYDVTVYQVGWRLGGKGASGRGPAGRIEEHGLHVWMGFYENAFRLLRECYDELDRDWRDVFFPDPYIGVTDRDRFGRWTTRAAVFPPFKGEPGDPIESGNNPFTVPNYLRHTAVLLRTLLLGIENHSNEGTATTGQWSGHETPSAQPLVSDENGPVESGDDTQTTLQRITRLLRTGLVLSAAGIAEAVSLLEVVCRSLPTYPQNVVLRFVETLAAAVRDKFEALVELDDDLRFRWEILDLVLAIIVGVIRHKLVFDPRGFEAIDEYECIEWLKLNGASERATNSAFVRALYDLAFAYGGAGVERPGLAAGQALRGSVRMLFTYRGALFWKMRIGMGDAVFAPIYEVLTRRNVKFQFFHRLTNVGLNTDSTADRYVETLSFDVQARTKTGKPYEPLVPIKDVPCWPASPNFAQLEDGDALAANGTDFESHWDRHRADVRTLEVGKDFDFVVLGIGIGAVPSVCSELLAADKRWREMCEHVTTIATQAFQLWLQPEMEDLGWEHPPVNVTGYVDPFNTWADMRQLVPYEDWRRPPGSIAYFCNALADPEQPPSDEDIGYPKRRNAEVRRSAIAFLNEHVSVLWPKAVDADGKFRWHTLCDAFADGDTPIGTAHPFDTQFWTANVNPSDRYVLAQPGSLKYRISPLDRTFDNLTIAGDWTDAGFNEGCVEAAVMSGRLAAHALSLSPPLEDIVGYDHP